MTSLNPESCLRNPIRIGSDTEGAERICKEMEFSVPQLGHGVDSGELRSEILRSLEKVCSHEEHE